MGIFDKIKDINEMRKQAKQIELMLAAEEIIGKASGGKLTIIVDGNQNIKSVEVSESIVGDKADIGRSIREALTDLNAKHKKMLQTKFGSMMG
jgi:DNA-binding protein YbaB